MHVQIVVCCLEGKIVALINVKYAMHLSYGKGIEADPATANLIQEFREGLSKRPESKQTKEFKEDLFVNGLGEDPLGRVRCMGRGITRHKLCEISSHNAPTPQMVEQLQELQRLKDDLIHERKEVELMRLELDNRKEEFFKEKEQIVDQVANELIGMPEPQSSTKESAPPQPNSRKSLNFPMSPEQSSPVGSNVILFYSEIPKEIVVEGTILSIDPNEKIDEVALGYEFVKVVIRKAIKPDYLLLRPRRGVNTVQDAVGKSVAWEYIDSSGSCEEARQNILGISWDENEMSKNPFTLIMDTNKFNGTNYNDWMRNLRIVLDFKNPGYVLDKPLPTALPEGSSLEERLTFDKWLEDNRTFLGL
ncbi:UNVERIFIED_CONTAM: hypothetical protein Slati_3054400 [Sesamum latifolium]|uniref:Transposase Tnp1/En/Spm-like domain-containing protein n=1 Tax=Sesamum latifolium TaxID=2727402 RepID=A0AAW2UVQ8_9LAMI